MTPPIAIAMSGGVDSTVAALLMIKKGHSVVGVHFITGYEDAKTDAGPGCVQETAGIVETARKRLRPIAEHLGIPLEIYDIQNEFESSVVTYFAETYSAGQTPNPCMVCNPTIKFGTLLQAARRLGADHLATGHYARVRHTEKNGARQL